MQNIKIEYVNGALVALERDGVSYAHLPVSAIHFDHTAKIFPHLKIEIEAGGAPFVPAGQPQPAEPEHPPAAVEEVQPAKEGELLPPGDSAPRPARRPRHRNRNRNRSQ
ncbi:hypothetical protein [Klebsiella aerogenes]|uniref:hypothetical protein n=1 Tax=Klebsiella aerogenes TaxID=548 RepID=UPI0002AB7B94|nr:hypothetical protein [Klebsiella aerogenes]AML36113.1 Hypothetical protein EAG7_02368 [Klebsiella aerogenes]OOL23222.1 hypothetical protein BXQ27_18235 [Klebsiella aerogenes]CCG30843.1 hypothetical protein [Klebsiella aerogenes EA1509E]HBT2454329.1 hypothetical protein [Klebsiella aerogenes]HBT2461446.1 hypothetical protein [Klebsiella aerogenes]